ncbi:MAG: hypothetical protein Q7U04_05510 [Bacteriovorax sp.]|nr:hypothetical protein [Bacteriovorax sp.]
MKFLTFLSIAMLSFSSFANVKIIKSRVNGTAIETNKNVINILYPTITVDGKDYALFTNPDAGRFACKQMKMKYVNYDVDYNPSVDESINIRENGAIEYFGGVQIIKVLTCEL